MGVTMICAEVYSASLKSMGGWGRKGVRDSRKEIVVTLSMELRPKSEKIATNHNSTSTRSKRVQKIVGSRETISTYC